MRKVPFVFCLICVLFVLPSCATGYLLNEESTEPTEPVERFSGKIETDSFSIAVSGDYAQGIKADYLELVVYNSGSAPIVVDLNKSAYVGVYSSERMIDGETRVIHSSMSQPLFTVAPNSYLIRHLFNANQSGFIGNSGELKELNPRVSVCISVNGEDKYYEIALNKEEVRHDVIGTVKFSSVRIYPLFIPFGRTTDAIIRAAKNAAIKEYGEDVRVENIQYELNWNPLSLLFYFDCFGIVKNIKGTADVVRK